MQHTADNQEQDDGAQESIAKLPEPLKTGIEALSGVSMEDVHVHYDSSLPTQVEALAYTQGTDIYVAPGQEHYLAHEAWHVVQQKQGRVKPTLQARGKAINDEQALEREADGMGQQAAEYLSTRQQHSSEQQLIDGQPRDTQQPAPSPVFPLGTVIQRVWERGEVLRGGVTYRRWNAMEGDILKDGFWYKLKDPSGQWAEDENAHLAVDEVGKDLPEEEKGKDEKATGQDHDVPELVKAFTTLGYTRAGIFMSWGAGEQSVATGWKLHAGCAQGQWLQVATKVTALLRDLMLGHKVMVVQERLLTGNQRNKLITVWSNTSLNKMRAAIVSIDNILKELNVSPQDAIVPGHIMTGPTNRIATRYGGNQAVTAETLKSIGIAFTTGSRGLSGFTKSVLVYTITNPQYLGGALKGGQVPIYEGPDGGLRAYNGKTNPALMLQTTSDGQAILYPDSRDNPLQGEQMGAPLPSGFSAGGTPYVTLNDAQWDEYLQSVGRASIVLSDEKLKGKDLPSASAPVKEEKPKEPDLPPLASTPPSAPVKEEKLKEPQPPLAPPPSSASTPVASPSGKEEKLKGDEQVQANARQMLAGVYAKVQAILITPGGDYSQLWANYKSGQVRVPVRQILQRVETFYTAMLKVREDVQAVEHLDENLILLIGNTNDILQGVVMPALIEALALEKGQ